MIWSAEFNLIYRRPYFIGLQLTTLLTSITEVVFWLVYLCMDHNMKTIVFLVIFYKFEFIFLVVTAAFYCAEIYHHYINSNQRYVFDKELADGHWFLCSFFIPASFFCRLFPFTIDKMITTGPEDGNISLFLVSLALKVGNYLVTIFTAYEYKRSQETWAILDEEDRRNTYLNLY